MQLPIISSQEVEEIKALSKAEREALKEKINATDPALIFETAGSSRNPDKRKIICPICGNGKGDDHTPVEAKFENGTWLYHCFRGCGFSGDLLKIICHERNLNPHDFNDFCEALAVGARLTNELVPITDNPRSFKRDSSNNQHSDAEQLPLIEKDIADAQKHLDDLPTSQRRGLTLDTLRHFHCGYLDKWNSPKNRLKGLKFFSRRIIIPTDGGQHYNAVTLPADREGIKKKYWKQHAGKMELFNSDALNSDLIVVVEGEIDTMSIWQASDGTVAVVAVLGAGNWKKTFAPKFKALRGKEFLIVFDGTDKSNTGRNGAQILRGELGKYGIPAACRFFDDFLTADEREQFVDRSVDANEIFLTLGGERLNQLVGILIDDAREDLEAAKREIPADVQDFDCEQYETCADNDENALTAEQRKFLFSGTLTDRENGDRIAFLFGDRFKFVTNSNEWLTFDGGVWKHSTESNSAIYPFARSLQDRLIANARNASEKKFAKPFDSAKKTDAAIKLLRGHSGVRITSADLDTHKNLLNCLNGVIDLETGKLMEAAPELLITQQANAIFTGEHSPIVDNFLRDIMPRDDDRNALIRWLGYALTGEISEQCALFTTGEGSNGKSTLFELMINMLGGYATNLPVKAVVESRDSDANSTTTQLNVLAGARFALVDEFKPHHRLDVQQFKSLTGDRYLKIRRLHKEYETIELQAKLFLNGNEMPRLDNSRALSIQRRIRALSFRQTFSEERGNLDKDLPKKLATAEALAGMLTLCVEAAQLWYREGLLESSAMRDAKDAYLSENDFVEEFISERCEFSKGASISKKDFEERLKQEYPQETLPSRIRPRDLSKLITAALENHGVTYQRDKAGFTFKGVGWLGTPKQQSFADDFAGTPVDPKDIAF